MFLAYLLGLAFMSLTYVVAKAMGWSVSRAFRASLALVAMFLSAGGRVNAQVGTLSSNTFAGAVSDANVIAQTHLSLFYQVLPILVAIGLILWLIKLMRTKTGK